MKFVPSLPPATAAAKDDLDVEALAAVKAAKPVQPRTLPPLVVQPRARSQASSDDNTEQQQRLRKERVQGERRTYCRRIEHPPILLELRTGLERRKHNQRADDMTEHVNEKV